MERIVFSRKYVKSEQLDEIEVTIDEVHKLMYYVDYFNKNNFEEKIHLEKKIPELGALNKIYIRLIEIYEPIHLHFQSCYIDPYDYVSEGSKSYRSIEEFSKIKTQEMLTKGVDGARVILEKIYPVYIEYLSTVSSILAETRLFVDKIISTDSDFAEVIINSTDLTEDFYTIYPSKELVLNNKNEKKEKKGCYIASTVYGGYDTHEVWVLRRYRDEVLQKRPLGRFFIRVYYFISPIILSLFGQRKYFNRFWKAVLDKFIENLKRKGFKDTKYHDK